MPELSTYSDMNIILEKIMNARSVSEIDTLIPELKLEIDHILGKKVYLV